MARARPTPAHAHAHERAPLREAMRHFVAHCRASGISVTHQRLAIFEALAASPEHPSAEQIHRAVRKKIPTLSLATVYKNLDALREIGAVADVNPLHEQARFEAALEGTGAGRTHHHLVCTRCQRICDLFDPALDALRLREGHGFQVRAVKVQAEGLCPSCQQAGPASARTRRNGRRSA